MKTKLLLLLLIAGIFAKAQVTSGMLQEFRFNNSYVSESTLASFTNNSSTSFVADRFANPNAALQISGTGILSTIPSLPVGNAARSISIWIANTTTVNNPIFSYGSAATNQAYGFSVQNTSTTNFGFGNDLVATGYSIGVAWTHIVTTFDGTTAKIYYNGIERASGNKSTWNTIQSAFGLGRNVNAAGGFATIDDLRIYSRALTPAEVTQLYSQQNSGTSSNATIEYTFNNTYNNANGNTPFNASGSFTSFVNDRNNNPNGALRVNFQTSPGTTSANIIAPTGNNPRTVSIWYMASQNAGFPGIFNYGSAAQYKTFGLYLGATGNPIFQGNNYDNDFLGTHAVSTWHHAVVAFDGTNVTLYLDGVSKGSFARPLLNTTYGTNFFLGNFGDMRYDDLKIYTRALTASEVQSLYYNNNITTPVVAAPTATSPQSVCPNSNIPALSATGTSLKWYFDAVGGTEIGNSSGHILGNRTYYVSQTVGGLESPRTAVLVIVNPTPATPTALTQTFCVGSGARFSDIVTTGVNIRWFTNLQPQFGTEIVASTLIAQSGQYFFSQTVNGCESARGAVFINYFPTQFSNFSQVAPICIGVLLTPLPTTSSSGIVGVWSPALNNLATTTYTFTPNPGQCGATTTMTIVVNQTVMPTVSTTAATCAANGTASISNYNASATYVSTPVGATVGAAGVISGTTGTAYTFMATLGGCLSTSSASVTIPVQLTATATPTVSNTSSTCAANGTASISNYNASATYVSTPVGATVGAAGVISGTAGTAYTFVATLGGCPSTASASVTIPILLTATVTPTGSATQTFVTGATIANLIVNPANVTWYQTGANANANVGRLASSTLLVNGTTYYAVNESGTCRSANLAVTVSLTLSTENASKIVFTVFPNPATDFLNIETAVEIKAIEIFNIQGHRVLVSKNKQINVSDLSTGLYMIMIRDMENNVATKKIVIN